MNRPIIQRREGGTSVFNEAITSTGGMNLLGILDAPPWRIVLHRRWKWNPPEFTIDEIGQAPEKKAWRRDECGHVEQVQKWEFPRSREEIHGDDHADHPPMTRHSSLMNSQHAPEWELSREIDQQRRVVEHAIADTATDDHTSDAVGDEIGRIGARHEYDLILPSSGSKAMRPETWPDRKGCTMIENESVTGSIRIKSGCNFQRA